jgi:hypothetical protein
MIRGHVTDVCDPRDVETRRRLPKSSKSPFANIQLSLHLPQLSINYEGIILSLLNVYTKPCVEFFILVTHYMIHISASQIPLVPRD